MAPMRVAGTRNAIASAFADMPSGLRNSSLSASPGWVVTRRGAASPLFLVEIDDLDIGEPYSPACSENFNQRLAALERLQQARQHRPEPHEELTSPRVRQPDPHYHRSAAIERFPLSEILILRHDDRINADRIIPDRHVGGRPQSEMCSASCPWAANQRASAGGNWASTKKRIKSRAVPGGHSGARHIRAPP